MTCWCSGPQTPYLTVLLDANYKGHTTFRGITRGHTRSYATLCSRAFRSRFCNNKRRVALDLQRPVGPLHDAVQGPREVARGWAGFPAFLASCKPDHAIPPRLQLCIGRKPSNPTTSKIGEKKLAQKLLT